METDMYRKTWGRPSRARVAGTRSLWAAGLWAAGLIAALAAICPSGTTWAGGRVDARLAPPKQTTTPLPTLGDPKAPVTLMIFGDFQCPYTAMQVAVLRQLVQDHPSKVHVIWREFPLAFHQQAKPASVAAQEVFLQKGNKAFWDFHALVMANARGINDSALVTWAGQVGASPEKVRAALGSQTGRPASYVERDIKEGKALGVRGTPATFVFKKGTPLNRAKMLSGSRKYPDVRAEVDAL